MKKLLIADDEDGVRALVRMTLRAGSYGILEATDGDEALAVARQHLPELLLLDVMMPGLSGVEVCRALKADPQTAGMNILMLTARAQVKDRKAGLAAGADGYFTKPFSPLALISKVAEVFDGKATA